MSFQLKVEFLGLCLYLRDQVSGRLAVLMPDARKRTANPVHADDTEGVPHVGYLRFNLADLDPSFEPGTQEAPQFECIHLIDFQELDFGPPAPVQADLNVPEFEKIAPHPSDPARTVFELKPGIFSTNPPAELLMRTRLSGGTIEGAPAETFRFDQTLSPGQPYERSFANFVTWTLPVEGDQVTLRLRSFTGGVQTELTLRPSNAATVSLKIGNLCDKNPMEWEDLGLRHVDADDVDFKWMYRLLQPATGDFASVLNGAELPIPRVPPGTTSAGVEDCLSGQVGGSVPG